jgi:hypothetical protein
MGMDEDVPYGKGIVEAMRPFIEALLDEGLSDRIIQKHTGNLWLLGGEIIREVSVGEEYDEIAPADKLRESIGPDDGPLCRHITSEGEQRSFDATCGKLRRFLEKRHKAANKQIQPIAAKRGSG